MQVAGAAPASSSAHSDRQSLSVPWNILLQYEFELRKWAIKEAHRDGAPLGDKLHEATRNTELKELHFTSQVALSKRSGAFDPPPPSKWPRKGKGEKGDKGGKDGGKDGKGPKGTKSDGKIKVGETWFDLVSKTPDGRELCYAFNIRRGCQVKGASRKADVRASLAELCKDRLLGPNNTAASAAYPAGLCSLIATWVFSVFDGGGCGKVSSSQLLRLSELLPDEERIRRAAEVIEGQRSFTSGAFVHQDKDWKGCRLVLAAYTIGKDGLLSEQDRDNLVDKGFDLDYSRLRTGCEGPPLVGDFAGSVDEFVDGFGRCSPGRWKPSNRGRCLSSQATSFARDLRGRVRRFVLENVPDLAKATFRLATGHWDGPLFAPAPLAKLREDWFNMLPDPLRAREMIPHQPFYLRAMAQTLRILEDPDYHILEEGKFCFCNGVEVGHTSPLGPVPQVFRLRQKGQKYDESEWEPLMGNYRDGPEVEKALQEAFEKEESEGRMFPLSLAEARQRYPGSALRVAAQ
ncbi:unnamed protein product, partial [Symbiodinium necroappetens]